MYIIYVYIKHSMHVYNMYLVADALYHVAFCNIVKNVFYYITHSLSHDNLSRKSVMERHR